MSTDPSSSLNSQESPGNQEVPGWALKLMEKLESHDQLLKQLSDKAASKPGPSENQQNAEGEPGKATEKTQEPVVSPPVDEATAYAKPPDSGRSRGKLDTATLNSFPEFGSDDLSYAELWIADAERLAESLQLSKELLCLAVCQRAVGEVKELLDKYSDATKRDWPSLCKALQINFGKRTIMDKHKRELAVMDKVAGLPLAVAIDRVERLMVIADHSPADLQPIRALMRQFPEALTSKLYDRPDHWKTCKEALDDLMRVVERDLMLVGSQLVAKSPPKTAAPVPKAAPVAVAEPAEPVLVSGHTATAAPRFKARRPEPRRDGVLLCFWCHKAGHTWRQCPAVAEEEAKNKLSKN
jgi:hypothetical protein